MPAALVREALLRGEDLASVSGSGSARSLAAPAVTRIVVAGGMPGWQIALIAFGAALLSGTLAVLADRVRAAHRKTAPGPDGASNARFTGFHPSLKLPAETIAQIADDTRNGRACQFGVRQPGPCLDADAEWVKAGTDVRERNR